VTTKKRDKVSIKTKTKKQSDCKPPRISIPGKWTRTDIVDGPDVPTRARFHINIIHFDGNWRDGEPSITTVIDEYERDRKYFLRKILGVTGNMYHGNYYNQEVDIRVPIITYSASTKSALRMLEMMARKLCKYSEHCCGGGSDHVKLSAYWIDECEDDI
jgi:hypothetical protein